jgi:hypothetical protein
MMNKKLPLYLIVFLLLASSVVCEGIPGFAPTPTPTQTPTVTPSPTPEPTATPTPIPATILENIAGGATRLIDNEGGYQVIFNDDWHIFDLEEGDIEDLLAAAQGELPEIENLENMVGSGLKEGLRIIAINVNLDYFREGNPPNANVLYLEDRSVRGLPMEFVVESLSLGLVDIIPGAIVLEKSVEKSASGIEYGSVIYQISSPENRKVSQAYFNVPDGLVVLTFSVDPQDFEALKPIFQQVIDSFQLLDN